MKPTRTTCLFSALVATECGRGTRATRATKSPSASPPNFSRAARASSNATAASATTASASTAATSLRSTSASPGFARLEIDRAQRLHQRRQRLHRRAHDDVLPVRDAGLDAARVVRLADEAGHDLVVRLRAAELGQREAVADLDAFHGLDRHQRGGEPSVEPRLPRRVRAEPRRHALRANLDDAADGVTFRTRFVDALPKGVLVLHRAGHVDADLRQQSPSRPRRPRRTRPCAARSRARARRACPRART